MSSSSDQIAKGLSTHGPSWAGTDECAALLVSAHLHRQGFPRFIGRSHIGLRRPKGRIPKLAHKLEHAVIHCPGNAPKVKDPKNEEHAFDLVRRVQRWHLGNGWPDIGYHCAVWRNLMFGLRATDQQGAHAARGRWPISRKRRKSFNRSHLGVLILHPGNVEPHPATLRTLRHLIKDIVPGEVVPHRSLTRKECPGEHVCRWLHEHYGDRDPYTDEKGRRIR